MSTSRADAVLNQKKYSIEPSWVPLREAQLYAWRVFVVCIYEPPHVKRCWNCGWSRSTFLFAHRLAVLLAPGGGGTLAMRTV